MLFMLQIPPVMGVRDTAKELLPEVAGATKSSKVGLCLGNVNLVYCSDKKEFTNTDKTSQFPWTHSIKLEESEGEIFLYTFTRISANDIRAMQVFFERIFSNAQRYEKLLQHSMKDRLTQLLNKAVFRKCLEEEIFRCSCFGLSFCLVFLDIDNFKYINDTFGHLVGDKVLCEVSKILQASVRKKDIVARFGGDEFVILLPGMLPGEETVVLDRLLHEVENVENIENYKINISYGTAYYPQDGITAEKLIETADKRMYQNKKNEGGNC